MSQAVQRSLPRPVPQAAPDLRPSEVSFYVPAVDLPSRSRHTIKHGDSFLVMDSHGDIGASSGGADGFFHNDTRFVSLLELRLDGEVPLSLGSNVRDDNSALSADLTNPDIYVDGRVVMQKDTVHVVRTTYVHHNTAYQRVAVKNYSDRTVRFELSFRFASDFADIFEVRGASRPRRGIARAPSIGPDAVLLNYEGLDGVLRQTKVVFDPAPNTLEHHTARYQLTLAPNQVAAIFLALACGPAETWKPNFFKGLLAARRETRAATRNAATVQTSNAIFNEVLCRSMADLDMLLTETPDGRYPFAGIPWYSTTFGRDGLITAQEVLWLNPEIARGVLKRLARYQATTIDHEADAERGKILHEMRGGEMAALREVPFGLYYGSIDATPLFVMLAGLYVERTGDLQTLQELWPAIEAALAWIDGPGDPDGDGFLEYERASEEGLVNQGWKDSSIRSSTPTDRPRRPRSRSPKFRATSTPPNALLPGAPLCLATGCGQRRSIPRRGRSRSVSMRPFGVPTSTVMRWRSTATRSNAACALRTQGSCYSPGSSSPSAPRSSSISCCGRTSFRDGASAPSRAAKPATTRCPTTTGRSGRMTMR